MLLRVGSTGSSGNVYSIEHEEKLLLLDAGKPIAEIKKFIDFRVGDIEAALISHEHLDHSKAVKNLQNIGVRVWQPYLDIEHKRLKTHFGNFHVECFDLPHNGTENRGFLIKVDNTTICYLTDLEYLPYDLSKKNINVLMVECNHITELVDKSAENYKHIVLGHCSLDTCIGIIKANLSSLRTVVLIHMSGSGSFDKEKGMEKIKAEIPPYIDVMYARKGLEVNLDECPF